MRFPHRAHLTTMDIRENVSLAPLTTFKIGGPARYLALARTVEDVRKALAFAKEKERKIFILGGGSNVLFDDAGFDGLVVQVAIEGVERDRTAFIVGAGENWDALVGQAVESKLWGIENLSGIPGTVGGAVVQNIGAYGAALSQTFQWAEVFDTTDARVKRISKEEYASGYRESIFKHHEGRYAILRAAFALSDAPSPNISYKDLAQRFAGREPALPAIRSAVLKIRAAKFPDISKEGTAGSFFKNPLLPREDALKLQAHHPGMPLFDLPESKEVKVPLAWLLDHALNLRGYRMGTARLFERQPLVIVADRGATAEDVRTLAEFVQEKIRRSFKIEIEPEVRIV
ncbi:MAG TPA: UDP-N-acetylmuramate dehydrogenase [Candidatus Paceibacterota bacterium]|nr:UDP-N-acetylmuramate dehydrogenase [Candidatus Paceibacterota bacterium]